MTGLHEFTTVRFSSGYAMDDVDRFLDRAERALRTGDGSVTPEDVLEQRFEPTRFSEGYAVDEVDDYLDHALLPRLQQQHSGQDFAAGAAGPAASSDHVGTDRGPAGAGGSPPVRETSGRGAAATGSVLHSAERRPGLLQRLLGRGR